MRTSVSHPLQIAEVQSRDQYGRIGLTFCPGKVQEFAFSGAWARDLQLDLDAIEAWNASAVITLVEQHELEALGVTRLGEEVRSRYIDWLHLPIPDVSTPDPRFEQSWAAAGESLRARIRDGFNVLVHCKGGLGRAGMIAARLLTELGEDPSEAIRAIRQVRPGAIETPAQERHVLAQRTLTEPQPGTKNEERLDRAIGALVGLAVGDAVGTTLEFKPRDSYTPVSDMTGGGPFRLKAGEWTDDTAMALALGYSLLEVGELDQRDLLTRFCDWRSDGTYSCTGTCFDIGITTSAALDRWRRTGLPYAGSTSPDSAGNGSLMRLAPVAIRFCCDNAKLIAAAANQSVTTHAAPEAVSACVFYADLIAEAIRGTRRSEILKPRKTELRGRIKEIAAGSWRGRARSEIGSSGYVAHSLEAALWCIGRTGDFANAVLTAANLGEDADTTAAITGQLAGAIYGASGIPAEWLGRLAWRERIEGVARDLFRAGCST